VTFAEALDVLLGMKREGKIRHIGLSNVTTAQLEEALAKTPIACVQNLFSLNGSAPTAGSTSKEAPEAVLAVCEAQGIPFLPFFPLAVGSLTSARGSSRDRR
jgi:pyridoxine 4-dehydrogenase